MSRQEHEVIEQQKAEHGTMRSYIVGFILSLVFTAIPYYLVVSQAITGTVLLAAILAFAFLQMAVQLFFFLHLGRGPKPLYNVGFFLGTFGAILVVVVGSIYIMSHLHYNMSPDEKSVKLAEDEGIHQLHGKKTGACRGVYENHKIRIKNNIVTPGYIEAHQCDTISFIKEDDATRAITFGSHPQHLSYAGEMELQLHKNRAKTITLNQIGTYQFHDHHNPGTAGYFTVKSQ
ncbi:MAG TPA: cytochrome o ubiquinol oxidase subunit IV [Candidatus Limnocylindrales bacterium]|nr:cytochrome o ubiquinol oxidase subunit IV [Candidatus Limnocylindrales bacterium]